MKAKLLLFIILVICSIALAGCDSPTDSFDRVNENDPLSPVFSGGPVTGLQVSADTSGAITIKWGESNNIVTKNVIEKSLGDTMSFTPIAELDADAVKYVDSSLEVRKSTYYRLSSFVEIEGKDDVLYGRDQAQLSFGLIENDRFDFLEGNNSLQLSWNVDVPFYTHFIITSENIINEQQEDSVKIPAGRIEYTFEDPLLDIDFESRNYTITAIMETDGIEEVVVEKEIVFDTKYFFGPKYLFINILNEQDWEISWGGEAFFASEIELVRKRVQNGNIIYPEKVFSLPTGTKSYVDSLIIKGPVSYPNPNHFRRYSIRFKTETGASWGYASGDEIKIYSPSFNPLSSQNDPNSLTLKWSLDGPDTDLIKGFIIETPKHGFFQEYERVDANEPFQFTDTDVSATGNYTYRVRTMSSWPGPMVSYRYQNDGFYKIKHFIQTGMSYVTSMEMSSDKRYLVAASFREGADNSIKIYDTENIETHSFTKEIRIPGEQISDFKINQNDSIIYFPVPSENAIYKADFPSGDNIEKIIDDAWVDSSPVFNIDVSADNSFVVGTGGRGFVKKWSLATYEADFVFAEYSTPTFYLYKNIAISPDGNFILGNNGVPFILDAENGSVIKNLPWVSQNVADHQFSPNGDYFSFTTNFNSTHIYSTHNWIEEEVRPGQRADFHPNRQEILFSANDGIYTKNFETGNISKKFSSMDSGQLITANKENAIVYIGDKKFATVSGSGNIIIWDISDHSGWVKVNY